jgi:16S rRNA (cytosine1402-N4)-methyltransferase
VTVCAARASSTDEGSGGAIADACRYHRPVMADEIVQWLAPASGKTILDGTLGGGGHSRRLLEEGASVLALDRDEEALAQAQILRVGFPGTFHAYHSRFDLFPEILRREGIGGLDGILLDLGVSSRQLDAAERGFSFRRCGPLDMRMDASAGLSAAEIVNTWSEASLADVIHQYGEERAARRIAAAIARRRATKPFDTTEDLAELVATIVPRHGSQHPATKTFQGLRIAVNDELGCLERLLAVAADWLRPGGCLAIITFHSLEDRIVKRHLRRHSEAEIDRPEWPAPRPNPDCCYRLPVRSSIAPGEAEIRSNPRARSARLRIATRLPG